MVLIVDYLKYMILSEIWYVKKNIKYVFLSVPFTSKVCSLTAWNCYVTIISTLETCILKNCSLLESYYVFKWMY